MTKRSVPSNVRNVQHLDSNSEMARAQAANAGGEVQDAELIIETLQRTATHYNTLQHVEVQDAELLIENFLALVVRPSACDWRGEGGVGGRIKF